jgi:precorrin-6B methylase 1
MKRGSLVCVGSGIKSIGHFTLEAQGWIKQADLVVFCVADPATEIWIKKNAKKYFDLYTLYGNDKRRLNTYQQMVDVMVSNVRAGLDVCAVFYGHPGIFVLPTHVAIKTLREDGYQAVMLPAISAVDCLFADIGVDPAHDGCQMVEATDLLLRRRQILTDSHVIIWQIGCVGDLGFRFAGYDNRNFWVLVDYLLDSYRPDQEVVHYCASQFPICPPLIERMPLEGLRQANITGISTLYIPPAAPRPTVAEMAWKMGLKLKNSPAPSKHVLKQAATRSESAAKTRVRQVPTKPYVPSKDRSALADYISELAQSPFMLSEFNRDAEFASRIYTDMTEDERKALVSRHSGRIRVSLKAQEYSALDELDRLFGKGGIAAASAS